MLKTHATGRRKALSGCFLRDLGSVPFSPSDCQVSDRRRSASLNENIARSIRALHAIGEYTDQKQSDIRGRGLMQRQLKLEALEDRRLLAITLTPNTAIPLSPPALIMESRFRDGRTETFQFSANSGQLFSASIEIPASELEGRATLNDPNGEEQFTVPLTSIPTQFSFEATVNGVYDIRIDDHSGSPFVSGRIELIQNAQHESAGLIPPI